MLWRAKQNYPFTFWKSVSIVAELRESLFYFLGTGVQVMFSPELISLFFVLQRGGHQGEMDFWVPPSTRLLFTVTDAENKTQTQAEGLETKPMEQMESNSLTDDTAIPTQLGTYLKARWRLMESFEKHFICLETIWVWHCFCFPSHPKCFWTTP